MIQEIKDYLKYNKLYKKTSALDLPDERDIKYGKLLGVSAIALPEVWLPKYTEVQNQGNTMRCTLYSVAQANTCLNYLEAIANGVSKFKVCLGDEYLNKAKKKGFSEKVGWYIQEAIKLYVEVKELAGYAQVIGIEEIKQALVMGKEVCTGSNLIDWALSRGGIAVKGNGGGHAFPIVGYDRVGFIIKNSWGREWGSNGFFTLRYEDVGVLFTTYAILDKSDLPELMAEYAKVKGWTTVSEFRTYDYCTRMEAARFISNATGVADSKLWNGLRANDYVSLSEVKTMVNRATGATIAAEDGAKVKRWELIKYLKEAIKNK